MRFSYLGLVSVLFTVVVLLATFTVLEPFLLSLVWAAVIAIATWPMHEMVRKRIPGHENTAAGITTTVVALTIAAPMIVMLVFMIRDIQQFAAWLIQLDARGMPMPAWLPDLPFAGDYLARRWVSWFARPEGLSLLFQELMSAKLEFVQDYGQTLLLGVLARVARFFFALWVLFFLYRDGHKLVSRISIIGFRWLQKRWPSYAYHVPPAIRASVNGLVVVGLAEGILLALLFGAFEVPGAVTLGILAAAVALVPLAAPAFLALVAGWLWTQGAPGAGITVFVAGTLIVLLADYWVRPLLVQGDGEAPFLATLFGLLGGVATMGLLGLIIGPVIVALFFVMLREATVDERADLEF